MYYLFWVVVFIYVVNIVLVPAVPAGMYTGTETSMFRTHLNIGYTSHVPAILANFGQYQSIPGVPASTEKIILFYFIFLSFVIFKFLLGQNGNLFALIY